MKNYIRIFLARELATKISKATNSSDDRLCKDDSSWQRTWQCKIVKPVKLGGEHCQPHYITGKIARNNIHRAWLEALFIKACSIFIALPACHMGCQPNPCKTAASALPDFIYIIYIHGYVFHRNIPISGTKNCASKKLNQKWGW